MYPSNILVYIAGVLPQTLVQGLRPELITTMETACLWQMLPPEIRLMILDCVAHGYDEKFEPFARAGYATVCKDWQAFWERWTFKRLIICQGNLSDLKRLLHRVKSRLDYVEHLWLRIRLEEHDGIIKHSLEDGDTISRSVI